MVTVEASTLSKNHDELADVYMNYPFTDSLLYHVMIEVLTLKSVLLCKKDGVWRESGPKEVEILPRKNEDVSLTRPHLAASYKC